MVQLLGAPRVTLRRGTAAKESSLCCCCIARTSGEGGRWRLGSGGKSLKTGVIALFALIALQLCVASSHAHAGCPNEGLETSETIKSLRSFMESHGANVSHFCVKDSPLGGRGLFANKFLSSSTPKFSLPHDVILDPINPRPADIQKIMTNHSPSNVTEALMFFVLACRRLPTCSEQWRSLFQSFPPPSDVHLPIMWTIEERKLLTGTNAYLALQREDVAVSDASKVVNAALRASRLSEASMDEIKYMHAIAVSRAFDLKFPGRSVLTRVFIPFVDLLNHSPDVEIDYEFEKVDSLNTLFFKVSTNTSTANNSEVFVNYGNTKSSSSSMFLQYGMTTPATAADNFQIMSSIARDELFDLKHEALRVAGIDVNAPDDLLSITLGGDVPSKLLRLIAVLVSNKTYSARLVDIAKGRFLPASLESNSLASLSKGIVGILDGFSSDLESEAGVHPHRLFLARNQVQLERSILTR
jgi:hypothetical protein